MDLNLAGMAFQQVKSRFLECYEGTKTRVRTFFVNVEKTVFIKML